MSVIANVKQFIANILLKNELRSSPRVMKPNKFNFDSIKTIGILMDVTDSEDYEIVKRYVLYLREFKKNVKVIGFFNQKQLPPMTYSKLEYDFYSAKEMNWLGKPNSIVIQNFISEEFDLLIDLNVKNHFSLRYIAALSKARFKVGKYAKHDEEIYDMMIDSDNTKTVKYFLKQVDTYVMMLNKVEPSLN